MAGFPLGVLVCVPSVPARSTRCGDGAPGSPGAASTGYFIIVDAFDVTP
jgi:hypothetical protein